MTGLPEDDFAPPLSESTIYRPMRVKRVGGLARPAISGCRLPLVTSRSQDMRRVRDTAMLYSARGRFFPVSRCCRLTAAALACVFASLVPCAGVAAEWGYLVAMESEMESHDDYDRVVNGMLWEMLESFARIEIGREPESDAASLPESCSCHAVVWTLARFLGIRGCFAPAHDAISVMNDETPPHLTDEMDDSLRRLVPYEIQQMFSREQLWSHLSRNGLYYVVRQRTGTSRNKAWRFWNLDLSASSLGVSADKVTVSKHCDSRQGLDSAGVRSLVTSVFIRHARNLRYPIMRLPRVAGSFAILVRPSAQFPAQLDLDYCTYHVDVEEV